MLLLDPLVSKRMGGRYMQVGIEAHNDMTLIEIIQAVEDGFTDGGVEISLEEEVCRHDIEAMAIQIWKDMYGDFRIEGLYHVAREDRG
tara:strand:- start:14939 stop:15202 length:264 start_codon:yes stop_codon:yes gene_type:complete